MLVFLLLLFLAVETFAQSQTTGRIDGTVRDRTGAVVVQAEVTITSMVTREERRTKTNNSGDFAFLLLPAGTYRLSINANGFQQLLFDNVVVGITETTRIDVGLIVGPGPQVSVNVSTHTQANGPVLGRIVDSRPISELPLATRNFTQILALSHGTDTGLADNTGAGRNSQNISVNGARRTQNNFQINGVDTAQLRYECVGHLEAEIFIAVVCF